MIDACGYRLNVGIVLCNDEGQVFWAKRLGVDSWQFPQGGIKPHEKPLAAMYRELYEETGLKYRDVVLIGRTRHWLRYELPPRYVRRDSGPLCIGQKQIWYMLRLLTHESRICLDKTRRPEFDSWCWVDYWYPVHAVVYFKRKVYRRALTELEHCLTPAQLPGRPEGSTPSGINRQHRRPDDRIFTGSFR